MQKWDKRTGYQPEKVVGHVAMLGWRHVDGVVFNGLPGQSLKFDDNLGLVDCKPIGAGESASDVSGKD